MVDCLLGNKSLRIFADKQILNKRILCFAIHKTAGQSSVGPVNTWLIQSWVDDVNQVAQYTETLCI